MSGRIKVSKPNKTLFLAILAIGFFSFTGSGAAGQTIITGQPESKPPAGYELSLRRWNTQGTFRMRSGPPDAQNTWELRHPLDAIIMEGAFSTGFNSPLNTLSISLGFGNIRKGTVTDTDWDEYGIPSDRSYSASQGDVASGSIASEYKVFNYKERFRLSGVFGYTFYSIAADYRNPTIVLDNYVPTRASDTRKWQVYDLARRVHLTRNGSGKTINEGSQTICPFPCVPE